MDRYLQIEPYVAGDLGAQTVMDTECHPPHVSVLDYELIVPPRDGLLATYPCFVASDSVRVVLEALGATGCGFRDIIVSKNEQFDAAWPDTEVPTLWWLTVCGRPGVDDLGVTPGGILVVSERVWVALSPFAMNAEVEEYITDRGSPIT